ncbi:predicted protein [Verticillium alfalfae VaMs.102]|uniref:Predicted protein n=1 Tax=Verticillium alfalfae (strain VaMs.102 / ATCC MYA-4576 / FGSC 10136) TaxID=526221 RepID=C9SGM1_VERA1|nr:predicted protein [Verticillium alfalfae VaMs.102]EEY18143.1 predicted protein [Verticillium alfalfae VaMs.102]
MDSMRHTVRSRPGALGHNQRHDHNHRPGTGEGRFQGIAAHLLRDKTADTAKGTRTGRPQVSERGMIVGLRRTRLRESTRVIVEKAAQEMDSLINVGNPAFELHNQLVRADVQWQRRTQVQQAGPFGDWLYKTIHAQDGPSTVRHLGCGLAVKTGEWSRAREGEKMEESSDLGG